MNASELIDKRIAELADWRGKRIARLRKLIHEAAPDVVEDWKWDTPVWTHNGNVLAVGSFHDHIKVNFFYGALLSDHRLFNAGLEAKTTRAIDIYEKDSIDETALKSLIRSAVELNDLKPIQAKPKPASAKSKVSSDLPKLAAPAQRALAGAGISNLKQLSHFSEKQIEELHGIGNNALTALRKSLKENGLSFADEK